MLDKLPNRDWNKGIMQNIMVISIKTKHKKDHEELKVLEFNGFKISQQKYKFFKEKRIYKARLFQFSTDGKSCYASMEQKCSTIRN